MPQLITPPVKTKTEGGYNATIYEIDPDDVDCLQGEIDTPGAGIVQKQWNDVGICRNADDTCNIDPNSPEVADLLKRLRGA